MITLLIRGNLVKLQLENGRVIDLPDSWGLVHDVNGSVLHPCDLFLTRYRVVNNNPSRINSKIKKAAKDYFDVGESDLVTGMVEIPTGPWQYIGDVTVIYYGRSGSNRKKGLYHHDFEFPVPLYIQRDKKAYRLALPDACIVNKRGFVWP